MSEVGSVAFSSLKPDGSLLADSLVTKSHRPCFEYNFSISFLHNHTITAHRVRNIFTMATGVDAKLLKSTKFPPEFSQKVDMEKVNLEVMKKFVP